MTFLRILAASAAVGALLAAPALADGGPQNGGVSSVQGKFGPVRLAPGDVGALPCTGTCAQWTAFLPALMALVPAASAIDVETNITDAPAGGDYIELRSGTIRAGGPLAGYIQGRYSLTANQMTGLFQAAGATTSGLVAAVPAAAQDLSNVAPATGRAALGLGSIALLNALDTGRATATGSTTSRAMADRLDDLSLALDNGLKCDGVTDDGPALQVLVNRVSAGVSPDIMLPAGTCVINTAVTSSTAPVHIKGQSFGEAAAPGTVLYTSNPAITPLTFTNYHATAGSSVEDLEIAQLHPAPAVGWTPTVYPPFIYNNGSPGFRLRRIYGFGVYDGFALNNVGRYEVTDIYGQFFHRVLTATSGYDLAHIQHFHIWPFWLDSMNATLPNAARDAVIAWEQANKDTIAFGRQDGATVRDIFSFSANAGITFIPDPAGPATNIMVDQIQCDSVVHCLKNVSGTQASVFLGALNSFGQKGVSSAVPYPGANAIYADANSSFFVTGGDVKQGFADTNVVELDSTTSTSNVYLHTVQTYLTAGTSASSVLSVARTAGGVAPHIVSVDQPLNISLSSGSFLAAANWATTNAKIRIPGLDYQIIENPTAAAFNGNSYAVENARSRMILEADDGNTISSIKIVLPPSPYDGQEVTITSNVPITAATISDPNGRPIVGNATSLSPFSPVRFKWTNTGAAITWFRQ